MPKVNCQICGNEFYVKPSHQKLGYGKYCSRKCNGEAQKRGKSVKCYICDKEVWKIPKDLERSKSGLYFCSKSCSTKWRNAYFSREKHSNWKNGVTTYRKILSNTDVELKCIDCGISDSRVLVAHHMDKNRKNNTADNLCWLCMNCHHLRHNS